MPNFDIPPVFFYEIKEKEKCLVHFSLYACNISPGSGSGSAFGFWVGSGSRSVKKTDPKRCFLDGPVRFLDGPGRNQDNGNHREIDYLPKSEQRKEMAC